jgi:hypothetical protein
MAVHKGERHLPSIRDLIELGPAVEERIRLEARPRAHTVEFYVLTRGAERALDAIDAQMSQPTGALFWIGGAPGAGKTHFVNYLLAIDRKTALPVNEARAVFGLELTGHPRAEDLERQVLEVLTHELGRNHRDAALWRQMRGAEALTVALDNARRSGIRTVTMAVDFSASEPDSAFEYLATVAEVSGAVKQPKFTVIAAGRGRAPAEANVFDVAPAEDEQVVVAIGRARRLKENADALVDDFYRETDSGDFEPAAIFPFHPVSVQTFRALANPPGTIAETARLARDALAASREAVHTPLRRLVMPTDLMHSALIRARVEERLGDSGREALKIARGAAEHSGNGERAIAGQIVDTLVLAHFAGDSATLKIAELEARLPRELDESAPSRAERVLNGLAERSKGVIRFDSGAARFDPHAAGAPEIAAFNEAIALVRRFDPTIAPAHDVADFKDKLKRLGEAMADSLERAHRASETLAPIVRETQGKLPPERETAMADFIALASGGPASLLEIAGDPVRREQAMKTLAAYEGLSAAALAVPRIVRMRDYLRGTGLRWSSADDPAKSFRISALESECALLESQLDPARVLGGEQNFDSLHAAVQQFRWTYVREYTAAHARWRKEMERLVPMLEDARRHLEALRRLNAIGSLGPAEGEGLDASVAEMGRRIVRCELEGPLAPEMTPRCPQCGFVLGTLSPASELEELFDKIRAALRAKLAALSRNAITRLIREHDRTRRLDGFLRITQAAQTEALVKVLDENLAGYLGRLIEENIAAAEKDEAEERGEASGERAAAVRRLAAERPKAPKVKPSTRSGHPNKAPR